MSNTKSDEEKRSMQLHVRVNRRDHAVLAAAARKSKFGGDLSAWARVTLLTAAENLGVTPETVTVPAAKPKVTKGKAAPPAPREGGPAAPPEGGEG